MLGWISTQPRAKLPGIANVLICTVLVQAASTGNVRTDMGGSIASWRKDTEKNTCYQNFEFEPT